MTLHEMGRRLKAFDVRQEVVAVLEEASTSDAAQTLNQSQLGNGVLSTGDTIANKLVGGRTTYGVQQRRYRESMGLQVKHYDLNVTGAWWKTIGIDKVTLQTFTIDAEKSEKSDDINNMFGKEVLGLTDASKATFTRDTFGPELRRRITAKTGFKFT